MRGGAGAGVTAGANRRRIGLAAARCSCAAACARLAPVCVEMCDGAGAALTEPVRLSACLSVSGLGCRPACALRALGAPLRFLLDGAQA